MAEMTLRVSSLDGVEADIGRPVGVVVRHARRPRTDAAKTGN